jgi:predicted DNA-binding transcriptional regulator AlpA
MVRRIVRLPAVKGMTALSTSQVYVGMDEGWFPRCAKLFPGSNAVGWFEDEIEAYVKSRADMRDAQVKAKAEGAPDPEPKALWPSSKKDLKGLKALNAKHAAARAAKAAAPKPAPKPRRARYQPHPDLSDRLAPYPDEETVG